MATIVDYLTWRGDLSLNKVPFNEVDAMILSQMAYFPWDKTVNKSFRSKPVLLAKAIGKLDWSNEWIAYKDFLIDLSKMLAESVRFGDLSVIGFVNDIDHEMGTQFCAVTFILNKGIFVAFRGTDSSIAGWKENMELAYEEEVPAQKKSIDYLKHAAASFPGPVMTGGHSKGGNLAVYSAAFVNELVNRRISAVYNFDGPGFNSKVITKPQFEKLSSKVHTFVPQDSLIGMLLEHEEDYNVVLSTEKGGANQHYMYSWQVTRDSLVIEESLSKIGKFSSSNLSSWINSMTFEEKKSFINIIIGIVEKENIKTVDELMNSKVIISLLADYQALDATQKKKVMGTISGLRSTIFDSLRAKYIDPIQTRTIDTAEKVREKALEIKDNLLEREE